MSKKNGWVYLIKTSDQMKVGLTINSLKMRLANYASHSPIPIELLHSVFVENPQILEVDLLKQVKTSERTDWVVFTQDGANYCIDKMDNYKKLNPAVLAKKEVRDNRDFERMTVPFTQVANSVLNNPLLTTSAKGLFAYLYSKPDSWNFSYIRIAKDHKESKNTILKILKELEGFGYLQREKLADGRVVYNLYYEPNTKVGSQGQKPNTKVGRDQSWERPKFGTISNTELISNIDKESNIDFATGIKEIFEIFYKTINPTINFANKTMRSAAENLIKKVGIERARNAANYAVTCQAQKYAPVITNPAQLLNKYAELQVFASKELKEQQPKGIRI